MIMFVYKLSLNARPFQVISAFAILLSSSGYSLPAIASPKAVLREATVFKSPTPFNNSVLISQNSANSKIRLEAKKEILAAYKNQLEDLKRSEIESQKKLVNSHIHLEIQLSIFKSQIRIFNGHKVLLEIARAEGNIPLISNLESQISLDEQLAKNTIQSIDFAKQLKEVAEQQLNNDRLLKENMIKQIEVAEADAAFEMNRSR
jgi:hypothetical protein